MQLIEIELAALRAGSRVRFSGPNLHGSEGLV